MLTSNESDKLNGLYAVPEVHETLEKFINLSRRMKTFFDEQIQEHKAQAVMAHADHAAIGQVTAHTKTLIRRVDMLHKENESLLKWSLRLEQEHKRQRGEIEHLIEMVARLVQVTRPNEADLVTLNARIDGLSINVAEIKKTQWYDELTPREHSD